MKKIMHKAFSGDDVHTGYLTDYKWVAVDNMYTSFPKKSGKYLVIDHYGHLRELYCTSSAKTDRGLFEQAAGIRNGTAYIDDHEMTDTDIMDLWRNPWGRWYCWEENEDFYEDLRVITPDNPDYPLYYLDLDLESTFEIDSNGELEADGEPIFVDEHGKPIEKGETK